MKSYPYYLPRYDKWEVQHKINGAISAVQFATFNEALGFHKQETEKPCPTNLHLPADNE
jgi:pterin-4a-carbinolamine dehydratase